MSEPPRRLRSTYWFGKEHLSGFGLRAWMKSQGIPDNGFDGRPIIGICNTWSELTPCNASLRQLADFVRRGVLEAGGVPVEFPVLSLGETNVRPTAMLYRNLLSMDVEEAIRSNPIDGVVLLVGCDKTTPALLMGAASCDLPAIALSAGPMLNGYFRGRRLGSGTDVFRFMNMMRAGEISPKECELAERAISRGPGTCMTMGTASTMACLTEALGLSLPTNGAIPAVDARRLELAQLTGRRVVDMVREDLRMSRVVTRESFENAIRLNGAIGGSTNAVLHLLALAGRMQIPLTIDDWDKIGADVPCLVNLMPSGDYLMEDFFFAGGLPAVVKEFADLIDRGTMTVNGRTLWENCADSVVEDRRVIFPIKSPFKTSGGIAVLRGNLCPDGAIIKPSAATPQLMQHTGRAVVFDGLTDLEHRIDGPDLLIDERSVVVLRNCGPKGFPGMPEVANTPIPTKLWKAGVRDLVRISDARMSGTAAGTVVLHVAPEAAIGGPLSLVRTGDQIELDVKRRSLTVNVSDATLASRRLEQPAPEPAPTGGYTELFRTHVLQSDRGVDFDFLVGCRGAAPPRGAH
jgi:L-arabonate dehydrase